MKKLAYFLLLIILPVISMGQNEVNHHQSDINFKDVMELKGFIYFKSDTTLVTGRVIRYNKKNIAKKYIFVLNGKPDDMGWIPFKDQVKLPEESGLGSLLSIPAHFLDKNINYSNEDYNNTSKTESYLSRQQENTSKAYHKMEERNDIQKNLSNNIINGPFEEYYKKGQIRIKGNYKDAKLNGEWKEYHKNGQLKLRGYYLNTKRVGEWKFFDESGKLIKTVSYD